MANAVKLEWRMLYADEESYGPYAITTWHASFTPLDSDAETCANQLRAGVGSFFDTNGGSGRKVQEYLSSLLTGVVKVRYFDLSDPAPRPGIEMDDYSLTISTTGDALPPQVAACISTQCDPYAGHRRQSFYNRSYIGPLNSLTLFGDTGRPSDNFRHTLVEGYQNLVETLDTFGVDSARPCVYSPTHDSSGLVTSYWTDDCFDIQRRRGLESTNKYRDTDL